ncbi:MAG: hypothetical protein WCF65_01295 [Parachlamydiaceae bacterium]
MFESAVVSLTPEKLAKKVKILNEDLSPMKAYNALFSPSPERCAVALNQFPVEEETETMVLLKKNYTMQVNQKIVRESLDFPIKLVEGAQGDFHQVYMLEKNENQLVSGVLNEKIIVKMPRNELCNPDAYTRAAERARQEFKTWLKNADDQYKKIKSQLSVVTIYNDIQKDGFFIEEKITPLKDSNYISLWNREYVSSDAATVLSKVKSFFDYALKDTSYLPLDLSLNNFGVADNGDVVLVDFREIEMDRDFFDDDRIPYDLVAGDNLKSCAQFNPEVVAYFCDSIRGTKLYEQLMVGNTFKDHQGSWGWEV